MLQSARGITADKSFHLSFECTSIDVLESVGYKQDVMGRAIVTDNTFVMLYVYVLCCSQLLRQYKAKCLDIL